MYILFSGMHDAGYTVIESELEQIFKSIDASQQGHIGIPQKQCVEQRDAAAVLDFKLWVEHLNLRSSSRSTPSNTSILREAYLRNICGDLSSDCFSKHCIVYLVGLPVPEGYNEFISTLLARRVVVREEQLREIFDKFDKKGEGRLTLDTLRGILKCSK